MKFSDRFLARYEVVRKLGQGGMGEVVLARDRTTGADVAVKTILAGNFSNDEGRERFLREARITQALAHPAIIRTVDAGEEEGFLFLALEYVSGGDLALFLREQRRLSAELFYLIVPPLLDGVAFAHSRGVVHRDLKPANIFLDADRRPRIADFGLAKDQTNQGFRTATGIVMGTPTYMAPEIALGRRAVPESDQYALGVILHELLGGVPPFAADNMMALLRLHIDQPPPPLELRRTDVPDALGTVIMRALAKRPEERWPSVEAMAAAIRAVQDSGVAWNPRVVPETVIGVGAVNLNDMDTRAPAPLELPPSPPTVVPAPPAPAAPAGVLSTQVAGAPAGRASGKFRRGTGSGVRQRPSFRVATVAPPPPSNVWKYASVVASALALATGGALLLRKPPSPPAVQSPRPAVSPSPQAPASFELVVRRRRKHAIISWKPKHTVSMVSVQYDKGPITKNGVDHVRINVDEKPTPCRVFLTPRAGDEPIERPYRLEDVQDHVVVGRLASYVAAIANDDIYQRFFRALDEEPSWNKLAENPDEQSVQRAADETGLRPQLELHAEAQFVERLEQAADSLNYGGHQAAGAIWQHAIRLARFEIFCSLYSLRARSRACLEAVRFLYAAEAEKPVLGPNGNALLPGTGGYERPGWRLFFPAQEADGVLAVLDAALANKEKTLDKEQLERWTHLEPELESGRADAFRGLSVAACVASYARRGGVELIRVLPYVPPKTNEYFLPSEYVEEQKEHHLAFQGRRVVLGPIDLPGLLDAGAKRWRAPGIDLEVVVQMSKCAFDHARITLREGGPLLDFLPAPGLATSRQIPRPVRIGCRVPGLLIASKGSKTDITPRLSVHTYPGLGRVRDAAEEAVTDSAKLKVERVFVRRVDVPPAP